MERLIQDLRYAVRSLARSPGLALTAVVTLALGIGANIALFSLINGALWSPPPGVGEADGLVWTTLSSPRLRQPIGVDFSDYQDFRDRAGVFAELAAFSDESVALGGDGEPERLDAEMVTANYFSVLRMSPVLGRGFLPEEDRTPGTHPVAVIGYDLWQTRFGADPGVLGRTVTVNGHPFTVVGVAPKGFRGLSEIEEPTQLWVPVMMHPVVSPHLGDLMEKGYGMRPFWAVGRLKAGVSHERARVALETLTRQTAAAHPEHYEQVSADVLRFGGIESKRGSGGMVEPLVLAAAVTMIVLLIACGNVANLLLARAAGRRREIAIRSAIGASRGRIVRQLLVESLVLALAGGTGGVLLAVWVVDLFLALSPLPFPMPVALDGSALLVALTLAVLTGVVFGLAPALRASRVELTPALKGEAGGAWGRIRPQRTLVAGQLALSFLLLVGAGILMRSLREAIAADQAIPARNEVLTLSVDLAAQGYSPEAIRAFKLEILERAASLPGVEAASLTWRNPYRGIMFGSPLTLAADERDQGGSPASPRYLFHPVWPGLFRTLAVPMKRGRDFTPDDREGAPQVAVVNETAARRFWPGRDPLGERFRMGSDTVPWTTVIGVVEDAAYERRGDEMLPAVYVPEPQWNEGSSTTLLVRSRGHASTLFRPLRAQIREMDPNLPVFDIFTLGQAIDQHRVGHRIGTTLLALFGVLALGLATIGLHGVVAYTVTQRTREIAVRVALGASRLRILRLFARDALQMALLGVGMGTLLALAATRLLAGALGAGSRDVYTIGLIALLLLGVTLLASYLPARRAARADPMAALRAE